MVYSKYITSNKTQTNSKSVFAFLLMGYIISSYIANQVFNTSLVQQIFLYTLAVFSVFYIFSKIKYYKFNLYLRWLVLLITLSIISAFYALNENAVYNKIYNLFVCMFLGVSFSAFCESFEDVLLILKTFAISGALLMLVLLITDRYHDERLGTEAFGNANIFALLMMLSLICSFYLLINAYRKKKLFYFIISALIIIGLIMSGGRKYFLVPFLFLYFYLAGKI